MEALRHAHRLTCLLLAWFAMHVGLAMAQPVVDLQPLDPICSVSGPGTRMPGDAGSGSHAAGHTHDCPACMLGALPPEAFSFAAHQAPAAAPLPVLPPALAVRDVVPFSARGPPRA